MKPTLLNLLWPLKGADNTESSDNAVTDLVRFQNCVHLFVQILCKIAHLPENLLLFLI